MITVDGVVESAKAIANLLDVAEYEVDGKTIEKPFYKLEAKGNKVLVVVYLDEDDTGIIQNLKILTKDGIIFFETTDFIEKDDSTGFITGFSLELIPKEAEFKDWGMLKEILA